MATTPEPRHRRLMTSRWLAPYGALLLAIMLTVTAVAALRSGAASSAPRSSSGSTATAPMERATGSDVVQCRSAPSLCERGEEIAAAIPYPWRELGYEIRIAPPPDDWHAGVTRHDSRVIELYIRTGSTRDGLERTLAHEIAHALHTVCPDRLSRWRAQRDLDASVPDHVRAPHDYDSVAEDFAEAFSQHLGYGTSRSTVGDPVTTVWLETNEDLFGLCTR